MSESEDVLSLARLERQGLVPSFFNISLEVQVLGANAALNAACFQNISNS